jgi:hypothetical protein
MYSINNSMQDSVQNKDQNLKFGAKNDISVHRAVHEP